MVRRAVEAGRLSLHGWHCVIESGQVHVFDAVLGAFVSAAEAARTPLRRHRRPAGTGARQGPARPSARAGGGRRRVWRPRDRPIDPARVVNEPVRAELVEAFRQAQGERILDSVITRAGSIKERILSAGCAVQNLLLMATACGWGSALNSGKAMKSNALRSLFALGPQERALCCLSATAVRCARWRAVFAGGCCARG